MWHCVGSAWRCVESVLIAWRVREFAFQVRGIAWRVRENHMRQSATIPRQGVDFQVDVLVALKPPLQNPRLSAPCEVGLCENALGCVWVESGDGCTFFRGLGSSSSRDINEVLQGVSEF